MAKKRCRTYGGMVTHQAMVQETRGFPDYSTEQALDFRQRLHSAVYLQQERYETPSINISCTMT